MGRECGFCGAAIAESRDKRTRFCSVECQAENYNRRRRAAVVERRAERALRCGWCQEPLGVDRRTSSRFCDQRCTDAFHNHARASVAAREARDGREPCAFCKGPIPATRRAGAVFCSYRCKNAAGNVPSDKRRASNRRYMLKYTRGITVEEFDAMLLAQGGRCGICGTTEPGGRRGTFNVDHDHVTGKVRKLLCYGCNVGLGHFRDDPELCDAAAAYLRGHATV